MPAGKSFVSVIALGFIAVAVSGVLLERQAGGRAAAAGTPGYVKAVACKSCHEQVYAAWQDSHHGWALRSPTEDNVLGDFNGSTFEHAGVTSRFYKRDGQHFVETQGADGASAEFKIKFTVGVAPLQQYLVELDRGRLQALDTAWDAGGNRWYHLYPDQQIAPGDGLHWTGPYKNWQTRCAECHQTNFVKGYEPNSRTYQSTWSDLTVACEACHGPGQAHVAWARNPAGYDTAQFSGVNEKGLSVAFGAKAPQTELQLCGRCHSRREPLGADSPPPSKPFADHYNLALLRQGLYHADGQIDDEVYVYGSFLQSKMHARGVTCSNCHEPHSAKLKASGNAVCTQCHNPAGNPDFATLKPANYDSTDHHQHKDGSPGAQCVSCHMPAKNYMVIDARRDHSFKVPRPDLSVKLGTPDACTGCHDDKTAVWAADQVKQWYPDSRSGNPHYAEGFAKARAGAIDATVRNQLIATATDIMQPAIVRATALDYLRPVIDAQALEQLSDLLQDNSELVRTATARLFRTAPAQLRVKRLVPLMEDKLTSVRIAAARELINIPPTGFPEPSRAKVAAAIVEFQNSLALKSDYPETQMSIAGVALNIRNMSAAEAALKEALRLDPQLGNAWHMLARIQLASRKPETAQRTLTAGLKALPEAGPLHQLMGITLLQLGQVDRAVKSLRAAADAMPQDAGVRIDLADVLTRLNQHTRAEPVIQEAYNLAPGNPNVLALLATNRMKQGALKEARDIVQQLVTRYPRYQLTPALRTLLSLPQQK